MKTSQNAEYALERCREEARETMLANLQGNIRTDGLEDEADNDWEVIEMESESSIATPLIAASSAGAKEQNTTIKAAASLNEFEVGLMMCDIDAGEDPEEVAARLTTSITEMVRAMSSVTLKDLEDSKKDLLLEYNKNKAALLAGRKEKKRGDYTGLGRRRHDDYESNTCDDCLGD